MGPQEHTNQIFVTKINFNRKKNMSRALICLFSLFYLVIMFNSVTADKDDKWSKHGSTFLYGPFHDSFGHFQPIRTGAKRTMFNNEALFLPLTFLDDQKINLCLTLEQFLSISGPFHDSFGHFQ